MNSYNIALREIPISYYSVPGQLVFRGAACNGIVISIFKPRTKNSLPYFSFNSSENNFFRPQRYPRKNENKPKKKPVTRRKSRRRKKPSCFYYYYYYYFFYFISSKSSVVRCEQIALNLCPTTPFTARK